MVAPLGLTNETECAILAGEVVQVHSGATTGYRRVCKRADDPERGHQDKPLPAALRCAPVPWHSALEAAAALPNDGRRPRVSFWQVAWVVDRGFPRLVVHGLEVPFHWYSAPVQLRLATRLAQLEIGRLRSVFAAFDPEALARESA